MSPLEIPGKPLGRLLDKRSQGACPHCDRSYRVLKVKENKEKKSKVNLYCPHCGNKVREADKNAD